MTDLLVIRSSFSDPSVQEFGASFSAAHDDVERTPPGDEKKRMENRPSDTVPRTMKAVLSCSPGNPNYKRKLKIRALRWGTRSRVKHALAREEILASKCSSKPGLPVSKQAAGDMAAVSPSSKQAAGDMAAVSPSSKQAAGDMAAVSPRISAIVRRSKSKDVRRGRNMQKAEEGYGDQSSPLRNSLEEASRWTGEKRAKIIASPPTSEAAHYKQIDDPRDTEEFWNVYDDPEQLDEVQERLALYRIKAYELFWEGKDLDIAQLKEEYSPDTLRDEGYFQRYEVNREWYFDPEYCKRSALDDYQRLVLRKDVTYISWESYHRTCTTLKCDQEFLQFYEQLSHKLKLVEDDDVEPDKKHFDAQRTRYESTADTEAPKIAAHFSSIYADLVDVGITDCIWSAMFDLDHKDLDHVLFEIWKRVAKDKVGFTAALEDLYKLNLYPLQHRFIKAEVEELPLRINMKEAYHSHLAHIDENVPEDEVVVLIKESVTKILSKQLTYVDYVRKKIEVAKEIGVIP